MTFYEPTEKPLSLQEAQIRQTCLATLDDLTALREELDKGHNIPRSDAYALLNYIDSLRSA